jgi:lipoyl-dependent peroxiredoxin
MSNKEEIMPMRKSKAVWEGTLKDGNGTIELRDGKIKEKYSFASRFEDGKGTNPEELIAAAHAGCFSMALSMILGDAGFPPKKITTSAFVTIDKTGGGFGITSIKLSTSGLVPGISAGDFKKYAEMAKTGCPVSKALSGVPVIELEAVLE